MEQDKNPYGPPWFYDEKDHTIKTVEERRRGHIYIAKEVHPDDGELLAKAPEYKKALKECMYIFGQVGYELPDWIEERLENVNAYELAQD